MQQKLKKNMGQNVITTVICPITNSIPLFGKSKSRQCFVKTTKCSIKYYLCQNLSATENVSDNSNIEIDFKYSQLLLSLR